MKNIAYILFTLIFTTCLAPNKDSRKINPNITSSSKETSDKMKVLFSAYTTVKSGLNYREKPSLSSEILGKFNYGTKVEIVDDYNYSQFSVDDEKRGYLVGKWVGVKKDTSIVYVFNAYLHKSSSEIEKHMKTVNNELQIVYNDSFNINTNRYLIIEKHIRTSNQLADYILVKLLDNNREIYNHKIKYLFKESYGLKRIKDTKPIFEYFTLFDECPSTEYKQTFSIVGSRIIKINENYSEAEEKEE